MGQISLTTDVPRHSIVRIIPSNSNAKLAFDLHVRNSDPSAHHWKYIKANHAGVPDFRYDCPWELRSHFKNPENELMQQWSGFWEIQLDNDRVNNAGCLWTIGRGTDGPELTARDVDIAVTPEKIEFRGIAAIHAIMELHPRSGALMITGVDDEHKLEYKTECPVELRKNQSSVLLFPVNHITLGSLEFEIIYECQGNDEYSKLVESRNNLMTKLGLDIPHPKLYAIPRMFPVQIGKCIVHGTISGGGFGTVSAGIHADSGEPMAIKTILLKTRHQSQIFRSELHAATKFPDQEGLLQAHGARCEHGGPSPCGIYPEQVYLMMPLAKSDYASFCWTDMPTSQLMTFLLGPLQGLVALHRRGYMHRDVTLRNMLILSVRPPTGVLCDFGKTIQARHDTDPRIGPKPTLAPEITHKGLRRYDNKIDVWSFGYACCSILFPLYCQNKEPTDDDWHDDIIDKIASYRLIGAEEYRLGLVISRMLVREPELRITAQDASHQLGGSSRKSQLPQGAIPSRFGENLLGSGQLDHILAKQDVLPLFGEGQRQLVPCKRKRGLYTSKGANPALRAPVRRREAPEQQEDEEEQPLFCNDSHGLASLFEGDSQVSPNDTVPLSDV